MDFSDDDSGAAFWEFMNSGDREFPLFLEPEDLPAVEPPVADKKKTSSPAPRLPKAPPVPKVPKVPKAKSKLDITLNAGVHLTYRGFLEVEDFKGVILPKFDTCGELYWSVVWERSDKLDAYDHTHVFVGWTDREKKLRIYDARWFDVKGVHCHIQHTDRKSNLKAPQELSWPEFVLTKYHMKAPVDVKELPFLVETNPLQHNAEKVPKKVKTASGIEGYSLTDIINCRKRKMSVPDTMIELGIPLKYVTQVAKLHSFYPHEEDSSSFLPTGVDLARCKREVIDPWYPMEDRVKYTLILVGPSGIGKSVAARSLFKNPFVCRSPEALKGLTAAHDGICMDDCDFSSYRGENVINLVQIPLHATIQSARFTDVRVRAIPLVITSNIQPFFEIGCGKHMFTGVTIEPQIDAIKRRIKVVTLPNESLFI